jgi:hypothetical protein
MLKLGWDSPTVVKRLLGSNRLRFIALPWLVFDE